MQRSMKTRWTGTVPSHEAVGATQGQESHRVMCGIPSLRKRGAAVKHRLWNIVRGASSVFDSHFASFDSFESDFQPENSQCSSDLYL